MSYSNKEKNVANAIVAALEQDGICCWIAPRDINPGRSWGEAINEAIEGSQVMVIVLSTHSNQSRQVVREGERAVAKNVIIIYFFTIEDSDSTSAKAYFLSKVILHTCDLIFGLDQCTWKQMLENGFISVDDGDLDNLIFIKKYKGLDGISAIAA